MQKPSIKDILEGENEFEFYELMQQYRHWPINDPKGVMIAFDNVKKFIQEKTVDKIKEIYTRGYINSWGTNETEYFIEASNNAGIDFGEVSDYFVKRGKR